MDKNKNDHLFMPEDHMDRLYNSRNSLVKFVHCQRLDAIVNSIPSHSGIKVLDAGCGEGHLIEGMHKKNPHNFYYGVDVTEVAVLKAQQRCPFANVGIMDLVGLKFEDGFFDVVIITEVLEHVINYELVVAELKRVLKTGGFLIITFPNEALWTISRFLLGRRPIKVPDHANSFTPKKMKDVVNLNLAYRENLPFNLIFSFSLGCLMKFKK